jgi:phosphatidate cytidylyltransferase
MKIRSITGACYFLVLIGFYLLKYFIHDFLFDLLAYAFAVIGTIEMLRAVKEKTTKTERVLVLIFAIVCIPACAISEYFFRYGLHIIGVCFTGLSVALLSLLVLKNEETTLENIGVALLSAVYPTLLLSTLVLANHVPELPKMHEAGFNSNLLILFAFLISALSDTFAYLFGRFLKGKYPKKLAPTISPNKTVIGGIGGIVGGVVGGLAMYFVYNAIFVGNYANMEIWLPIYLIMGLMVALATEFGDLVESCIKRQVGIKDMGKIMPGHGGVLDRIDGMLFASPFIMLVFLLV